MSVEFHDLLAAIRRAEFVLDLIGKGDQNALTYASSIASDFRGLIKKAGCEPVDRPGRRSGLGAAKKGKKATPLPFYAAEEPTYWDSVQSIAQDVKESCPNPNDNNCRSERIHEDVDGSAWIIYYDNNEIVLRETNNEPDPREVRG